MWYESDAFTYYRNVPGFDKKIAETLFMNQYLFLSHVIPRVNDLK